MLVNKLNLLFEEQLNGWDLAKNNYDDLKQVKIKTLPVKGREYKIQFNPARILSSAARVDVQSIRDRKCFLCSNHLPPEQKGITFKNKYTILVNPYPIFQRHLTIPTVKHTPQHIASRFGDMLDLTKQLDDFIVFYNGPKCGASAPDHFHFQAGNKGFLPIEKNRDEYQSINIESNDKEEIIEHFRQIYLSLPLQPNDTEPMMNILTWYESDRWVVCIFPRKKHRPSCYNAKGDANLLISPAAVDLGGVFITPLEKDFLKITEEDIVRILNEI